MWKQCGVAVLLIGCKFSTSGNTTSSPTSTSPSASPSTSPSTAPPSAPEPASASQPPAAPPSTNASGPSKPMVMPDLAILTVEQATEALRRAGYERTLSVDDYSCGDTTTDGRIVEPGRICYQMPGAGNNTGSKLPVSVRVQSKNPYEGALHTKPWVFMPDLVGKTVDQARDALKAAGVTATATTIVKAGCKAQIVCETFPKAEVRTGVGSEKLLFIGK